MSRIDELELRIKHLHVGKETIETSLATQQEIIREAEKELAALKAESEKPLEFDLLYSEIDKRLFLGGIQGSHIRHIKLIEKKPVVITKDMAGEYSDKISATLCGGGYYASPYAICTYLKIFGIEARCGDE